MASLDLDKFKVKLKELRLSRNETQEQVAKAIGTSQPIIAAYESTSNKSKNGETKKPVSPSIDNLIRLSEHFGVPVDVLIGRSDTNTLGNRTYADVFFSIYDMIKKGILLPSKYDCANSANSSQSDFTSYQRGYLLNITDPIISSLIGQYTESSSAFESIPAVRKIWLETIRKEFDYEFIQKRTDLDFVIDLDRCVQYEAYQNKIQDPGMQYSYALKIFYGNKEERANWEKKIEVLREQDKKNNEGNPFL